MEAPSKKPITAPSKNIIDYFESKDYLPKIRGVRKERNFDAKVESYIDWPLANPVSPDRRRAPSSDNRNQYPALYSLRRWL